MAHSPASDLRPGTKGVVLLNLGTPDRPEPEAVKKYLKEFLMDPYVLDIPFIARWFLVNRMILPKRSKSSAEAYKKVWTERGSPLLFHLEDLTGKVQERLGPGWKVEPAMRYGAPSIERALLRLKEAAQGSLSELLILPLYPQYSLAATESSLKECKRLLAKVLPGTQARVLNPFYDNEYFIESFANRLKEHPEVLKYDHLLFSFHGLPERQIKRTDRSGQCFADKSCCDRFQNFNTNCYKAQCYETAKKIAQKLNLNSDRYTVCFQSRLGRTPWIKPYTDVVYRELPAKGVNTVGVLCPAFVSDCLETLEEIQIRARQEFISCGGTDLKLIPSLNANDDWAYGVSEMVRNSAIYFTNL